MALRTQLSPFDYDDVMLVPDQCRVLSRSAVDTSVQFGPRRFAIPVVPANMSTIVDQKLATWLAANGYFYVMHRFDVNAVDFARAMHDEGLYASVSLGVQEADRLLAQQFAYLDTPVDYVTLDIAHGDAKPMFEMVETLKRYSPSTFVIAGNVATPQAVHRLEAAGADAIKVGVGPGLACLTSPNTGFGTRGWQLSAVEWCAEAADEALIVADGGIRTHGDIAKSVAFGASMVMVGGMFAGHDESPGELQEVDGKPYKVFFGSASAEQKGEVKNVEGRSMLIDYRGPIAHTLQAMKENLQSAVSYGGGERLLDLQEALYVRR